MDGDYTDKWISCDATGISVRGYYFPWGTKHIPYASIRAYRRVGFASSARIWGSSSPRYWANLDPGRVNKHEALILDLGKAVRPFLTPDDTDAVESAIQQHTALGPARRDGKVPFV